MSSPLPVKRRKLNDATNSLSKPFVSPLKAANSSRTAVNQTQNGPSQPYRPSTLAHTIAYSSEATLTSSAAPERKNLLTTKSTPIRKSTITVSNRHSRDPAEIAAQKAVTSLELQIRTVRNEIDTLNQARRLTSSNRDAELEDLATRWKSATQTAAEEVFGTVKERVCRMGGVQAWRESEKQKFDRVHGLGEFAEKEAEGGEDDDEDCEFDSQGEELPEEEANWRKSEKRRMRQERQDAMEDGNEDTEAGDPGQKIDMVWQETGNDDDAFTIDMMLRSLNIELGVIGYDKVAQRWTC